MWFDNLNYLEVGNEPVLTVNSISTIALLKNVLSNIKNKETIHYKYVTGTLPSILEFEQLKNILNENGSIVYHHLISDDAGRYFWIFDHGMVDVEFSIGNKGYYVQISISTLSKDFLELVSKFLLSKFIVPLPRHDKVYVIASNHGDLYLQNLGTAGIPLIENNYNSNVVDDYKIIVNDLNSNTPSGRIAILEGPPGTGKTHLVRALLSDVPEAMFVLVSPELVTELSGPDFVPLLINNHHGMTGPIVLILEDADKCLVTRQSDNMNSIQALLNLSDGILGSLLDLRIVATTNAAKIDMEKAILRPGRLSARLDVGLLDYKKAKSVFNNLCPNVNFQKRTSAKKFSLAEVYSLARKAGYTPESR